MMKKMKSTTTLVLVAIDSKLQRYGIVISVFTLAIGLPSVIRTNVIGLAWSPSNNRLPYVSHDYESHRG